MILMYQQQTHIHTKNEPIKIIHIKKNMKIEHGKKKV